MLYKKIHRRYLREFRVGRRFMVWDKVYKMARKPHIQGSYIFVDGWNLICIRGRYSGQVRYKYKITWLD